MMRVLRTSMGVVRAPEKIDLYGHEHDNEIPEFLKHGLPAMAPEMLPNNPAFHPLESGL